MGKRKEPPSTDEEIDVDTPDVPPQKKHKKHKHKKHKKKKTLDESEGSQDVYEDGDSSKHPFKLKIKLSAGEKNQSTSSDKAKEKVTPTKVEKGTGVGPSPKSSAKKRKGRGKESGTSSEEERWLDAIESGKLEEVDDELKKIKPKDPKLMTARQRAMFERKSDKEPSPGGEQLMALPSGYKEKEKVLTAEAIQKAALKSQKRKQLADEKREKDKKKTMERLLKKQESKAGKANNKSRSAKKQVPRVTYCSNAAGVTISLPPGMEFPLNPQQTRIPPPVALCGIEGCNNPRKFACSKTNIPLCSLVCYRKIRATKTHSMMAMSQFSQNIFLV